MLYAQLSGSTASGPCSRGGSARHLCHHLPSCGSQLQATLANQRHESRGKHPAGAVAHSHGQVAQPDPQALGGALAAPPQQSQHSREEAKVSADAASTASIGKESSNRPPLEQDAGQVLRALCHYSPVDLADGPASLAKVRPYNAAEVQQALDYAKSRLSTLQLAQLSNLTAALAAAGHTDHDFMQQLGTAAAARLKAATRVMQHTQGLIAFRTITWLAVGFSRLGVLHVGLMEQIAVYGTHLLLRCPLRFSKRRQGQQVALLAGAYAALQLYPPQLYRAIGEHLKQHRHVVRLLGAQESMLLLWACARAGHKDPPAQLLVTQQATTQVGQMTCAGLAHAYMQCATVGITAAPLLAALRKAVRVKLSSMQPADLTALLMALAALGQQDLLYLDEIARAVFNKLANYTAAEVSASLSALAQLRYRNTWLLDRASKMLVSRRLRKAYQLTPQQLSDVLKSCCQLGYINPLLLGHLGSVSVEAQLPGCTAGQLAAVVQGYRQLGFQQPQLLQAAAVRLLQLAAAQDWQHGQDVTGQLQQASIRAEDQPASVSSQDPRGQLVQQQMGRMSDLIQAALELAAMPSPGGTSADRAVLPTALLGVAAGALSLVGSQASQSAATPGGTGNSDSSSASSPCSLQDLVCLQTAVQLCISTSPVTAQYATLPSRSEAMPASSAAGQVQGAQQPASAQIVVKALQELSQLQQLLQQQLVVAVAADAQRSAHCTGLLQLMQLLWLQEQVQLAAAGMSPVTPPAAGTGSGDVSACLQQHAISTGPQHALQVGDWALGLSAQEVDALVQQKRQQAEQELQQQRGQQQSQARLLQVVAAALAGGLQQLNTGLERQQPQQEELQVRTLYRIPHSPIVVPVVVLPSDAALGLAASSSQQHSPKSLRHEEVSGDAVLVQTQLHQRKVKLPPEAQQCLVQCQQSQRPLAVFPVGSMLPVALAASADLEGVGLQAWCTSNAPQQLLPTAGIWQRGLQAAGWDILVLEDQTAGSDEGD